MIFHTSGSDHSTPEAPPTTSNIREDGSYEIVFGNDQTNTDYTANGYNAYGFSANGSRKPDNETPAFTNQETKHSEKTRGKTVTAVLLSVTILLALCSVALSITALVMIQNNTENHSIGTRPAPPATFIPWTNPNVTVPTDAYAAATSRAVDSVVIIDTDSGTAGSGIIFGIQNTYSYIVTCNHVIDGESRIKITFHSGESCYAETVGQDARTDIAVLRVEKTDLVPIVLPNEESKTALGQAVIAIGNPLGVFGNSVSDGILSSLTRTVTVGGSTMELLQTTAAVNHGNSGGGLFDLSGQLIGMVNAKINKSSVEGIGFAIPVDTIKAVAGELILNGYVSGRPTLGFSSVMIDSNESYKNATTQYPDLENYIPRYTVGIPGWSSDEKITGGLYVVDTEGVAGYGDSAVKLQFGDRITAIGTVAIALDASEIQTALNAYSAGDTVQITFVRDQKTYVTDMILAEVGK